MGIFSGLKKQVAEKVVVPFATYLQNSMTSYSPDYEKFAKRAYDNPFFSSPLSEISRSFNTAKIGVYTKNRKGEVEKVQNHKVDKWLNKPNDMLTKDQYQKYWVLWYYIGGGMLMYKTKGVNKKSLYLYRPDTFAIDINKDNLKINKITLGQNQIVGEKLDQYSIVRAINPDDGIAGYGSEFRSPLRSLAQMGDMSNFALTHQNRQLKNSGRRTGILSYKKRMSKEKKEEVKKQFEGLGNKDAGSIAMVNGEDYDFQAMDITPAEMDWLNSVKFLREVISATIGVPIQLISTEGTTYNNVKEFKKKLYNDVVDPLLKLYCNSHTKHFEGDLKENEFIWYDLSEVEELKVDISEIVDKLASGLEGKVTLNEFRNLIQNMTGIQLDQLPESEGDVILVKANLTRIKDLFVPDTTTED